VSTELIIVLGIPAAYLVVSKALILKGAMKVPPVDASPKQS
jgi:hypothetical protein